MNDLQNLKPRLNEAYDYEPMPDGSLLYDQESGRIVTINPVAELILSFCDGETTIDEVFDKVSEEYEIPRDAYCDTVHQFLEEKVLVVPESS